MQRVLVIDNTRYLIPASLSAKDIQALAGFLVTLVQVHTEYTYSATDPSYVYYVGRGASVQLEDLELVTREEARRLATEGREAYEARKAREAEQA